MLEEVFDSRERERSSDCVREAMSIEGRNSGRSSGGSSDITAITGAASGGGRW